MTISDFGIMDYFNTKYPPPVPAFTYQVTAAYVCRLPQASAWRTPGLSCRISNPSSQPVSHVVTFRNARVSGTAYDYSESFSLTIPAGGYVDWFFNDNYPGMGGYYKTALGGDGVVDVWLEDDAGGNSAVTRLPEGAFGEAYCEYLV